MNLNYELLQLYVNKKLVKRKDFEVFLEDAQRLEIGIRDYLMTKEIITENTELEALAEYYCMQILFLADLRRDEALQLKEILRSNRDIQRAVSGKKQRFTCLLYDVFGWHLTAKIVRFCLNIRNRRV